MTVMTNSNNNNGNNYNKKSKDNDEDTDDNTHDTGKHMMLLKNCTNYLSPAKNEANVFPQMKSF